jgi:hypothetical protein
MASTAVFARSIFARMVFASVQEGAGGSSEFDRALSNALGLVDTVDVTFSVRNLNPSSALELTDSVAFTLPVKNESVLDTLALVQVPGIIWDIEITDTLALEDQGYNSYVLEDTLSLSQVVVIAKGRDLEHVLQLESEVAYNVILQRSLSNVLNLEQALTYEIDRPGVECQFSPFVGSGVGDTELPDTTAPVFGTATLTLTYPYVTPTTTLVLRNPDFGNQHNFEFVRINQVTRGGTQVVFSDPNWGKTETISVTIKALTEAEAEAFHTFLGNSLGTEIGLLDWYNRQWRGIITTPDAEITDLGNCRRTITFEFEGEEV